MMVRGRGRKAKRGREGRVYVVDGSNFGARKKGVLFERAGQRKNNTSLLRVEAWE